MGFLRIHNKDDIHFVTNRCEHEMFFQIPFAGPAGARCCFKSRSQALPARDAASNVACRLYLHMIRQIALPGEPELG